MFRKIFNHFFSQRFSAFSYININGNTAQPGQITTRVKWLKDIEIQGFTYNLREKKAFKKFRQENNLKKGQVWIG